MICSEDMNKGVVSTQARIEMIYAFFGIIIVLVIQGERSAFEIFLLLIISKFIFVTLMILFFPISWKNKYTD
tara:strand:+ start:1593 stop:1808 length:216 start_codon:yes stop_codon:yes gene_type:complete